MMSMLTTPGYDWFELTSIDTNPHDTDVENMIGAELHGVTDLRHPNKPAADMPVRVVPSKGADIDRSTKAGTPTFVAIAHNPAQAGAATGDMISFALLMPPNGKPVVLDRCSTGQAADALMAAAARSGESPEQVLRGAAANLGSPEGLALQNASQPTTSQPGTSVP